MPTLLTASDWIDLAQAVITGMAVVGAGWWAAQRFGDATATRTGVVMEVVDAIWIDSTSIWRVRIRNERRRQTVIGPLFFALRAASERSVLPGDDPAEIASWPEEEKLESLRQNLGSKLYEKTTETELLPLAAMERSMVVVLEPRPVVGPPALLPKVFVVDFGIQYVRWPRILLPPHREKSFDPVFGTLPVVPDRP